MGIRLSRRIKKNQSATVAYGIRRFLLGFLVVTFLSVNVVTLRQAHHLHGKKEDHSQAPYHFQSFQNSSSQKVSLESSREVSRQKNSTIWIPKDKPDPLVWKHLSFAWTDENGTEVVELQNDPYLSRLRNGTCPPTMQMRIDMTETGEWILASLDEHGIRKTLGGDEYYISYHHNKENDIDMKNLSAQEAEAPITAVAYSIDQRDGTYLLKFKSTPFHPEEPTDPSRGGFLTIHLEYTCDIGRIHFPKRNEWYTGGAVMRSYGPISVDVAPTIQRFQQPNLDGTIDLGQYHKVVMFGDSNIHGLYTASAHRFPNLKFLRKPDSPVTQRSMPRVFLPKISWFLNQTIQEEGSQKPHALLIGSACWDIVWPHGAGPHFKKHLRALKKMLETLKQHFANANVDIYWHSGYALQLHVAGGQGWETRNPLRYMSYSRSQELYEKQQQLLTEIGGITTLEFMEATYLSADLYNYLDARHIGPKLSERMLGWYYPTFAME